jgi:hypothetical protein
MRAVETGISSSSLDSLSGAGGFDFFCLPCLVTVAGASSSSSLDPVFGAGFLDFRCLAFFLTGAVTMASSSSPLDSLFGTEVLDFFFLLCFVTTAGAGSDSLELEVPEPASSMSELPNMPFLCTRTGMPDCILLSTSSSWAVNGFKEKDFFGVGRTTSESLLSSSSFLFLEGRDGEPSMATAAARLRTCGESPDAADAEGGNGEKVSLAWRFRVEARFGGITGGFEGFGA